MNQSRRNLTAAEIQIEKVEREIEKLKQSNAELMGQLSRPKSERTATGAAAPPREKPKRTLTIEVGTDTESNEVDEPEAQLFGSTREATETLA